MRRCLRGRGLLGGSVHITLTGAVAIEAGGQRIGEELLGGQQPRLLFASLTLERGRALSTDEVVEILWSHGPPTSWKTALRGIVFKARGFLEAAGIDRSSLVSERNRYELSLPDATIDVDEASRGVERAATLLEQDPEQARDLVNRARAVLSRPLLPGVDAPYLDRHRDELGRTHVRALELLGEVRTRLGEHADAVGVVEEALRLDPFRESSWRLLMHAHLAGGNAAEALRAFERCRLLLADELGADPAPETQELHTRVLRGMPAADRVPAADLIPAPVRAGPRADQPPYRGLRPFDTEHAELFHGRDADVQALVDRLARHRFVAVVGPSGAGKSSLVRAGLLPALERGAIPDSDTWRRVTFLPGVSPLKALARELVALDRRPAVRDAVDRLGTDTEALRHAAEAILDGVATSSRLLVVVDQFEEVFTLCGDDDERAAFVEALLSAARDPRGRTTVVLTMRADFYAHCAALPGLAAALNTSQHLVAVLGGDGLQQAIEAPARRAGLRFEDGLVGRILTDVAGEPGALPLLQHALLELWERRDGAVLTHDTYLASGGVAGALAQRAESVYDELDAGGQATVRRVLLRLCQPGEGTEDTRRRARLAELAAEPRQSGLVEALVERLTDARLLTTSAGPDGVPHVEVAHEALIGGWPRLRAWIEDDRAALVVHRRLTDAANEWDRHDRHPDYLYSGGRLGEAIELSDHDPEALNPVERAFVDAAVAARDRAQRRRRRVLRTTVSTLVVVALTFAGLTAVATSSRREADAQSALARSRALAASAAAQASADPELAILLAVAANEVAQTTEAESTLRLALARSHLRRAMGTEGRDHRVALSPDGTRLATGAIEGQAGVFDVGTGALLADLRDPTLGDVPPPARVVDHVSFDADGTRVLAAHRDGGVRVWDATTGELLQRLGGGPPGPVFAAWTGAGEILVAGAGGAAVWDPDLGQPARTIETPPPAAERSVVAGLTPDGSTAALVGAEELTIVELAGGEILASLPLPGPVRALRFAGDGSRLLVGTQAGTAVLWEWATDERRPLDLERTLGPGPARIVFSAAFSHDGTLLATGHSTGDVLLWDGATGALVRAVEPQIAAVHVVAFSPDDRILVSGARNAHVAEVATGRRVLTLEGSRTAIQSMAFLADGRHLVTGGDEARVFEYRTAQLEVLEGHEGKIESVAVLADGTVVSGGNDGTARIWDLASGDARVVDVWPGTGVKAIPSPDGATLVTNAQPITPGAPGGAPVRVWETATGALVHELAVSQDDPLGLCRQACSATSAAFAPGGERFVVGADDGFARVWHTETGDVILEIEVGMPVFGVSWSPDGREITASTPQGPVHVFDADDGAPVRTLAGDVLGGSVDSTRGADHTADGTLVATPHFDGLARLWDATDGSLVAELTHATVAPNVRFSPDDAFLATGGGVLSVWDVATRERLVELRGHRGPVSAVDFLPDGRTLVTGSHDNTVRVWRCEVCAPLDELLTLARERVTRDLTPIERARYLLDEA